jgi:nucleoid DNA-binding protein
MTKSDMVPRVADRCRLTRQGAETVVQPLVDGITNALTRREKVEICGLGSFRVCGHPPRYGQESLSGPRGARASQAHPGFEGC